MRMVKKILNQKEIIETREIASLRIHVERATERMKNFAVLTKIMDLNIAPRLHQILVIVAFICNLSPLLLG